MKKSILPAVMITVMALVGTGTSPAVAAGPSVKVAKISTKVAPANGTKKIVPNIKVSGNVRIESRFLTVSKGGKTIARNKSSVSLRPGKYTVTQRVRYRTWSNVTTTKTLVRQGEIVQDYTGDTTYFVDSCAVRNISGNRFSANCDVVDDDWTRVGTTVARGAIITEGEPEAPLYSLVLDGTGEEFGPSDEELVVGDVFEPSELAASAPIVRRTTVRKYSARKSQALTQTLTIRSGPKVRTCATKSDFDKVRAHFDAPERYGYSRSVVAHLMHNSGTRSQYSEFDGDVIEFRNYKPCNSNHLISVGFYNGRAYTKSFYS